MRDRLLALSLAALAAGSLVTCASGQQGKEQAAPPIDTVICTGPLGVSTGAPRNESRIFSAVI